MPEYLPWQTVDALTTV